MTAPEQPVCGRGSCTPDCGMGHCYLADGPYQDPEHAHKASEQANEQAANEPPTAPKSPANDLRQRLTDAIRDATHVCIECDECGDGQCEDLPIIATTVGGDSDSGPIVIAAEGQPEAFADVCAAVVRPALDAKDAEIARLREQIAYYNRRWHQAMDDGDDKFLWVLQERSRAVSAERRSDRYRTAWESARRGRRSWRQRAEAAEAALATQNAENDRLDQHWADLACRTNERDQWREEARRMHQNCDHWRKRAEAAEAALATQNAENDRLDQLLIDERAITARLGRELAALRAQQDGGAK